MQDRQPAADGVRARGQSLVRQRSHDGNCTTAFGSPSSSASSAVRSSASPLADTTSSGEESRSARAETTNGRAASGAVMFNSGSVRRSTSPANALSLHVTAANPCRAGVDTRLSLVSRAVPVFPERLQLWA